MKEMIQAILTVGLAVLLACFIFAAPFCVSYYLCEQSTAVSLAVAIVWAVICLVILLTTPERNHREQS